MECETDALFQEIQLYFPGGADPIAAVIDLLQLIYLL